MSNIVNFKQEVQARVRVHNIEAEQAVLGILMLNNQMIDSIPHLESKHFYDPVHSRIYEALTKRIALGLVADAVTLKNMLVMDPGIAELGGTDYLARCCSAVVSIASAADYAIVIMDAWRRRAAAEIIEESLEKLPGADDVDDVLAAQESAIMELDAAPISRQSGATMQMALDTAIDRMNRAFHGEELPGVATTIEPLDEVIGKMQPGDYVLVAGRPSMGKSAVAGEIARRVAKQDIAVIWWCHEMAPEDNAERLLAAEAYEAGTTVSYRDARRGAMSEDEFKGLLFAGRGIEGLPIEYIEPSITDVRRLAHEFRVRTRRHLRAGRKVLLIADYLQQVGGDGRSRYEIVTNASAAFKALAMELRVPFLVLSQLSRKVEDRDNKRPNLSDLRESGQIEQDANTVILLYRDEYYLERMIQADPDDDRIADLEAALARCRGKMECIVAKQRSGPLRTAYVGFTPASNWVGSLRRNDDRQEEFKV